MIKSVKFRKIVRSVVALSVMVLASRSGIAASAVGAGGLPGSADPARLQERLSPVAPEQGESQDIARPPHAELTPPPEPKKGFVLKAVVFEGVTAFPNNQVQKIGAPFIGHRADLATAQYIAAQLTQMYRDHGYFLSRAVVPEQDAQNGVLKIVAIEGYVAQVTIDGDKARALAEGDHLGIINEVARRIQAMKPLRDTKLQKILLLLNDLPGLRAHAILKPLPQDTAPLGAVGLVIQLETKRPDYSVSFDNFGSRYTGPGEISASAGFGNILTAGDRVTLSSLVTTTVREAKALQGAYVLPLNADGLSLNLNGGYSNVQPGFTLRPLGIDSNSYNGGFQLSQTVLRTRRASVSLAAGFDASNITTDFFGGNLYKDRIRALRLSSLFSVTDDWNGVNNGGVILSQGLDILGARKTGSDDLSRADGHSDFTKILATASRLQQVTDSWQVYGAASGQYAFEPLLASEQFGYGGQAFGRAYDPSEITGDSGMSGAAELRYNGIPEWQRTIVQPFGFYDIGKIWEDDGGGTETIASGASAGAGFRFTSFDVVNGSITGAFPLTRRVSTPQPYTSGDGPRLLLQFGAHF